MLIRFTVENFLSFKKRVEFSMIAGRQHKHPDHILPRTKSRDLRLLKMGVIHGPNASGKTNLIKAMDFARNLIVEGRSEGQHTSVIPFRFDTSSKDKPSTFQFEIKEKGTTYVYGFEVDTVQVHAEWLYEIRNKKHRLIFERSTDSDGDSCVTTNDPDSAFEKSRDFVEVLEDSLRPNQLFLKHSVELKVTYFMDIYDWFRTKLVLIFPDTKLSVGFGIQFKNSADYKMRFDNMIRAFDLGFQEIELPEYDFESEWRLSPDSKEYILDKIREMPRESNGTVSAYLPDLNIYIEVEEFDDIRAYKFTTVHKVSGSDHPESLELTEESDGTQRLFELMPALIDLSIEERERVFVIDELDLRLHSLLSHKVLEQFLVKSKRQRSQLIVTTHEIMLLDLELLRRDEVWLINKDGQGRSSLYSLEEFHPRYDRDIRKSYLQGRFGAIPLLPSRRKLEMQR